MTKNANTNLLIFLVITTIINIVLYIMYRDNVTLVSFSIAFLIIVTFLYRNKNNKHG